MQIWRGAPVNCAKIRPKGEQHFATLDGPVLTQQQLGDLVLNTVNKQHNTLSVTWQCFVAQGFDLAGIVKFYSKLDPRSP